MDRGEFVLRLGVTVAGGAVVGANVRGDGRFLLFLPVFALAGLEAVLGRVVADGTGVLYVRRAVRTYAIPVSAIECVSAPARGGARLILRPGTTRISSLRLPMMGTAADLRRLCTDLDLDVI